MVLENGHSDSYSLQRVNCHQRIRFCEQLPSKLHDFAGRFVSLHKLIYLHVAIPEFTSTDLKCSYASFETLQAQATSISVGVVNCTNEVLCPSPQIYPYDCCWRNADDRNTVFVFQNPGNMPQSSSASLMASSRSSIINCAIIESSL